MVVTGRELGVVHRNHWNQQIRWISTGKCNRLQRSTQILLHLPAQQDQTPEQRNHTGNITGVPWSWWWWGWRWWSNEASGVTHENRITVVVRQTDGWYFTKWWQKESWWLATDGKIGIKKMLKASSICVKRISGNLIGSLEKNRRKKVFRLIYSKKPIRLQKNDVMLFWSLVIGSRFQS